jgi:hypothetical protein
VFVCKCFGGGYNKVQFKKKDLYNQVGEQKYQQVSDASAAIKYFKELKSKDPMVFVKFTIDNDKRLQNLFWVDGEVK